MPKLKDAPIGRLIEQLSPCVVDIGARGGVDEDMLPIGWATHVVGFEPEEEEAARLAGLADPRWKKVTMLPFAVGGHAGDAVLHVPESKQGASLLRHNSDMTERFGYPNLHITKNEIPVHTVTLDGLMQADKLPRADYIKVDIEGAELDVLHAAKQVLNDCVALKVECSFLDQRIGQPLIWDVAPFLLQEGFAIVEIHDVIRWRRRNLPAHPYRTGFKMPYSRGQLAQCDLIALRSPSPTLTDEQALRLIVLSATLGYFDHAASTLRAKPGLLQEVERRHGFDLEIQLQRWALSNGQRETRKAIRSALRHLVPLTRSLIGTLPYTKPTSPY
jgi:FkbM family methyltransferase